MNYFLHSAGPATYPTLILGWVFAGIAVAVCVIIAVLLLIALFRRRIAVAENDITRDGHGLRWVYIGTSISTAVLLAMTVYALVTLNNVITPPQVPALTITVTGYQWWWEAIYDDGLVTANEIHIPTGVPIFTATEKCRCTACFLGAGTGG